VIEHPRCAPTEPLVSSDLYRATIARAAGSPVIINAIPSSRPSARREIHRGLALRDMVMKMRRSDPLRCKSGLWFPCIADR
jgi:hypothetical protein